MLVVLLTLISLSSPKYACFLEHPTLSIMIEWYRNIDFVANISDAYLSLSKM